MVTLDKWDSHLDLAISDDGNEATCLHTDGFQYMWKGCRGTHGITGGTFMFECKVVENLRVSMPDTSARNQNIFRIGCSLPMSSLFLGDTAESWAWGGTGKKSSNNKFSDFGGEFGPGDVIGVIMDADNLTVSFSKNGKFMGIAFTGIDPAIRTVGLFPHILCKNVRVQMNFSKLTAWYKPPKNVFFINDAGSYCMVDNPIEHPRRMSEAEFIMLVGLPACGKTYWALKHMEENPKKGYTLLGTNTVIDQMKVVGLNRKGNYAQRWMELITLATPVFNKLCEIAGKSTRHIILDQTNVFQKARQRKISEYQAFGKRTAVVIVNDEDCLQHRTEKRETEEGKFVPVEAVMGMKQNFSKPQLSEGFTHIEYIEAPEMEAQRLIKRYNDSGWDFSRRNPDKGKKGEKGSKGKGKGQQGNKPQVRLDQRNASDLTFDKHGFIAKQNDKDATEGPAARGRSRSPLRDVEWNDEQERLKVDYFGRNGAGGDNQLSGSGFQSIQGASATGKKRITHERDSVRGAYKNFLSLPLGR